MNKLHIAQPRTLAEAHELLSQDGRKAAPLAGGTDLIGALKDHLHPNPPALLVNLKKLEGLAGVRKGEGCVTIGALEKLSAIADNSLILEKLPLLAQAARSVGSPQLRNMGTVGGNVCQEVRCWYYRYPDQIGGAIHCLRKGGTGCPAVKGDNRYHAVTGGKGCFAASPSDLACALAALQGSYLISSAKGEREVDTAEFHTPLGVALAPGELVTGVRVRIPGQTARQFFRKYTVRDPIDFAVVSVAGVVEEREGEAVKARLALGAIAPYPLRIREAEDFLLGKKITAEVAEEAAKLAFQGARPLSGNAYKVEIGKRLLVESLADGGAYLPTRLNPGPPDHFSGKRFGWNWADCTEENCIGKR